MKDLKLILAIAIGLTFSVTSCVFDFDDDDDGFGCLRGRGPIVEEILSMDVFEGIDLQISADVYITQGSDFEVRVDGYQNLIDDLDTRVRNGIWEIDFSGCVRNVDDFRIYITMPDIEFLQISGSGMIYGDNVFVTNDIELSILGSGDMDVALDADDITARIIGSGNMRLEGTADELDVVISGSGDLKAFNLQSNVCDVRIIGSGDAEVTVLDTLDVRIEGSGDVLFKGDPELNISVLGSGDVIDAN